MNLYRIKGDKIRKAVFDGHPNIMPDVSIYFFAPKSLGHVKSPKVWIWLNRHNKYGAYKTVKYPFYDIKWKYFLNSISNTNAFTLSEQQKYREIAIKVCSPLRDLTNSLNQMHAIVRRAGLFRSACFPIPLYFLIFC